MGRSEKKNNIINDLLRHKYTSAINGLEEEGVKVDPKLKQVFEKWEDRDNQNAYYGTSPSKQELNMKDIELQGSAGRGGAVQKLMHLIRTSLTVGVIGYGVLWYYGIV